MTINAKGETFREGDMVTVVNPNNEHDYIEIDDMGYVPLGTGGRVLSVSGNVALVHFDEFHMYDSYAEFMADNEEDVDMSDHEDESGEYRIFWVSTRKITKGADSTAREYTNESMHRLDTLPTFASVEEGMRALRAQKVDTITTSNENV
jgi:hypothetical protein